MRKKILIAILILGLMFYLHADALASGTGNQTISVTISAINEISISGNPGGLIVGTASAGSNPNPVSDSTTSYHLTTNGSSKKITGQLDATMPDYTTLTVNLTAPSGGTSAGDVALNSSAANLVTGITRSRGSALGITYTFAATVEAGIVASTSRTVTFTIIDGP